MKMKYLFILIMSLSLFSCENEVKLTFENPLAVDRADEVIVLTRADLAAKLDLKEGMLPVFETGEDELIPSQVDDLDGDGKWDEVVIILDFAASQTLDIEVKLVTESEYPVFETRTNLRLGIKQEDGSYKEYTKYSAPSYKEGFKVIAQAESVSWENDKIAFRNYLDCRNIKDLFGKLKPEMVMDKVGSKEMGNYHELSEWGMDVLHCGSSLGSGGIALLRNDSLIRLGSTEVYDYQNIVEGPVRSIFELRYSGWNVDGDMLEAVERITIYPGKYWFESDVTVKGCSENDQIVTGIVTSRLTREPFTLEAAGFKCVGTHDKQSENKDELGMAVLVPSKEAGKIGRTSNTNFFELGFETVKEKGFSHIISETCYISQKCQDAKPAKHYFFAVWGLDKDQWKTEDGFKKYIGEEAEKLSAPIKEL
jgi:hypothetical protein